MKRFDTADALSAVKGIFTALVCLVIALFVAGVSLKLMWRVFMLGWTLV
jgi:hypothetical protein